MPKVHYQQEFVKCGKSCHKCPHGPYWYAYWTVRGKLKKKYVGKTFKRIAIDAEAEAPPTQEKANPDNAIRNKMTASADLARKILGLAIGDTEAVSRKRYRELAKATHPDRGRDPEASVNINCAWDYLRQLKGWRR